jgi:hypothetical protein
MTELTYQRRRITISGYSSLIVYFLFKYTKSIIQWNMGKLSFVKWTSNSLREFSCHYLLRYKRKFAIRWDFKKELIEYG